MSQLPKELEIQLERVCFNSITEKAQESIKELIGTGKTPIEIEKIVLKRLEDMGITGHKKVSLASNWRLAAKHVQRMRKNRWSGATSDSENPLPDAV